MKEKGGEINQINKLIHEPARLAIMAVLSATDAVDFKYLMTSTELTKGNLSSHLAKLETAGYVAIEKRFIGKIPNTVVRLTPVGRTEFDIYLKNIRKVMKHL